MQNQIHRHSNMQSVLEATTRINAEEYALSVERWYNIRRARVRAKQIAANYNYAD